MQFINLLRITLIKILRIFNRCHIYYTLNILIFLLLLCLEGASAKQDSLLVVSPKSGDGISLLLKRYKLPQTLQMIENFKSINKNNLDKNGNLILQNHYILPIKVIPFNGKNIRTSINNPDRIFAEKIQKYNLQMASSNLKNSYKIDKVLWVPSVNIFEGTFLSENEIKDLSTISTDTVDKLNSNSPTLIPVNSEAQNITTKDNLLSNKTIGSTYVEPLLGKEYESVKILTNKLRGVTFYLDAGHGGIDPGAVGVSNNTEMHEDEYAYDVTIRLARKLIENGADVYMIVQDKEDGIRDSRYLNNKFDEVYYGDIPITMDNKQRLRTRGAIVNELHKKNAYGNTMHQLVTIHVDSRITAQRIDIFFYHKNDNGHSQSIANTLLHTIENKYNLAQPGRGYKGNLSHRGLYMINHTTPPAVYIELGNIQNQQDQIRFLEPNNRQAIANWLCEGFTIAYAKDVEKALNSIHKGPSKKFRKKTTTTKPNTKKNLKQLPKKKPKTNKK